MRSKVVRMDKKIVEKRQNMIDDIIMLMEKPNKKEASLIVDTMILRGLMKYKDFGIRKKAQKLPMN